MTTTETTPTPETTTAPGSTSSPTQTLPAKPIEGEPAAAVASAPPAARCKNCDAILMGRFCWNCGQSADVHMPSTRELVHEALEGLTHSDSRLWRTLLLLWFRPGVLTEEFLAGRRAASLPPFRLYLIISIAFFLMVSVFQSPDEEVVRISLSGKPTVATGPLSEVNCDDVQAFKNTHPDWDARLKRACTEIRRDNAKTLKKNLVAALPKAMFVLLPLIAFLHMLLYWRPRRRYAEQLVFFLHLQALFFSVGILIVVLAALAHRAPALAGAANVLQTLLGWTLPVYTVFALRRVFKNGWLKTLLKAFALAVAYVLLAFLAWLGAFVYAAMEL